MKFLSLCSGIEAASVAWHPLGLECIGVAEIEPFPCAVLAHHYPKVTNFGDISKFEEWPEEMFADVDAIVGGPPCQSFSIAGLRKGLNDDRGNLTLTYVRIIDHADRIRIRAGKPPVICVYENVPGLLSDKTNAFGNLLGGLAGEDVPLEPAGKRWTDAGCVFGPQRAIAWRIQDAQYHQLAQRRRRVFLIGSAREGFDPAAVLLEFEGVRRDTPPRRETGKAASGGAGTGAPVGFQSSQSGVRLVDTHATLDANNGPRRHNGVIVKADASLSHWDDPNAPHPTLNQSAKGSGGVGASNQELFSQRGAYLVGDKPLRRAGDQSNAELLEDMAGTLNCNKGQQGGILFDVTHSLRAEGFDASTQFGDIAGSLTARHDSSPCADRGMNVVVQRVTDDGTGRGTPLVPVAFSYKDSGNDATVDCSPTLRSLGAYDANGGGQMAVAFPIDTMNALRNDQGPRTGVGIGKQGDPSFTITKGNSHAVAYAFQPRVARNGRGDMGDLVNALNAQSGETGKGDAAPCVAIGWDEELNASVEQSGTLLRGGDGGRHDGVMTPNMAVRRLTPVECERLQGFPDDYTLIPWKKKPAADCPDGPRYKALGNSMAVPVMRWIGDRIARHLRGEL